MTDQTIREGLGFRVGGDNRVVMFCACVCIVQGVTEGRKYFLWEWCRVGHGKGAIPLPCGIFRALIWLMCLV